MLVTIIDHKFNEFNLYLIYSDLRGLVIRTADPYNQAGLLRRTDLVIPTDTVGITRSFLKILKGSVSPCRSVRNQSV
jgi:hypothetical protein